MTVLIVGAGPTGLTIALELARRGIEAKLIERRPEGSGLSRAAIILPRTLKILEPSGVTQTLLAEGESVDRIMVFRDNKQALAISSRSDTLGDGSPWAIPQDRTEAILRDHLGRLGGEVTWSTELADFQQSEDGVRVTYTDGGTDAFSYIVGADGIRSIVRKVLAISYDGIDLQETWSIADVEVADWPYQNTVVVCLVTGGRVAVVIHMATTRYRVISNTAQALETLPLGMNVSAVHREGKFNISVRQVNRYQVGRVFLAGDAAHCHSPVGGRGMNLGIADGAELARRLAEGDLDGYAADRHAAGAQVIAKTEKARKFATSTSRTNRMLLTALITAMNGLPFLQRRMKNFILYE